MKSGARTTNVTLHGRIAATTAMTTITDEATTMTTASTSAMAISNLTTTTAVTERSTAPCSASPHFAPREARWCGRTSSIEEAFGGATPATRGAGVPGGGAASTALTIAAGVADWLSR